MARTHDVSSQRQTVLVATSANMLFFILVLSLTGIQYSDTQDSTCLAELILGSIGFALLALTIYPLSCIKHTSPQPELQFPGGVDAFNTTVSGIFAIVNGVQKIRGEDTDDGRIRNFNTIMSIIYVIGLLLGGALGMSLTTLGKLLPAGLPDADKQPPGTGNRNASATQEHTTAETETEGQTPGPLSTETTALRVSREHAPFS